MKNQEQKTILLVEDETVTMMVETQQLKSYGYDVVPAKSGEEAVQIATTNDKIALVLMDVNLGDGMDGPEAAKQILEKRNLPIVFLSSHTDKEYVERIKGIAGYGYVVKASSDVVLHSSVEMALNLFKVQESNRRYKDLFENANDLIQSVNPDGRFGYINKKWLDTLGYTTEEACGLMFTDIIREDQIPHCVEIFKSLCMGKNADRVETVFISKEGREIYVEGSISPRFEGGVFKETRGIFRDITERKRAEEALRESERSLAITFSSIGDAVMATDAQSRIVRMNRVAEQLTGWPLKEALGRPLDEVFHIINQHTRLSLANPVSKVLETGKTQGLSNDTVLVSRQGVEFIIADSAAAIMDDQTGQAVGVVLVFRDQTKEHTAAEVLLLKTMLLEAQSETSIDGILAIDNEGHSLLFNKRFGEIWKIPQGVLDTKDDKKMLGFVLKQLKDPSEFSRKVAYLYEHKDEKSRDEIEFADGRCFDRYSAPLISTDGKSHGRIWYFRDITERKELQAKLLASEKLAVMGRLIADVAHEINNPLAIIAGNTSLLEEMVKEQAAIIPDSEDKAKMLEKIKKATNRCKNIVAALFVSTSPTMLGIKPAKINEVINESLESLDDQIKRQNVKVVKALAPRLPIIKADGHRLMQVFVNMFRNACGAMPEGGKLMIATRLHKPKAGTHGEAVGTGAAIEIEISDTGVGILEKDLTKIFDPFVTTKKDGKGVGLGLSVSYGIIREHGGSISVASEKGKGATFTIKVPVAPPR